MRSPDVFLQRLHTKLGADWTWTDDVVRMLWMVEHAGGLRFEVTQDRLADKQDADTIAIVLLKAVADGVRGRVCITSGYTTEDRDGELVKKPWARVEPVKDR